MVPRSFSLSAIPSHLPAAHDVDVQVVDRLRAVLAVVDHGAEAGAAQPLVVGDLLRDEHEVSQQHLLVLAHETQLAESVPRLGDHEEVDRGLRVHLSASQLGHRA